MNLTSVIINLPLFTQSAMKKIEDNTTLVFSVDVKANKQQIKQAVKRLYDTDEAKVSTLIRPDGGKKACMCPTGSRLRHFGCYQQNWNQLNWVQLANPKYKSFHHKKKIK